MVVLLWQLLVPGPFVQGASPNARHVILDVLSIEGDTFNVKDESGTEGTIQVGTDTEKYGHFQPGDRIDAWVYPDGHAKTIMILRSANVIQEDQQQEAAGPHQESRQQAQR